MASTIDQIDSYLKKNKKTLFSKLNEWYGRNKPIYEGKDFQQAFDDAKNLKYLWNSAQEAKGINSKIEAFNKLTTELDKWTDLEKLDDWEKQLEAQGLENWQVPEDRIEMDKMRLFGQLSNRPAIDETTDLSLDGVYSQNYNYDQMKVLAGQYGYDYTDKAERNEFLNKLREYHKQKNVEKAFSIDKDASFLDNLGTVITDFTLPVSKEYAKRNYENIDTDSKAGFLGDMWKPLAADALTNAAMFGLAGKAATRPAVAAGLNNVTAPVMREAANIALNDKSMRDAAIDAGGNIVTNIATPYAMNRAGRWLDRLWAGETKQGAQAILNQTANKVRDIEKQIAEGKVFLKETYNGPKYYTLKKGKLVEVSNAEAARAKDVIPPEDYKFYQLNRNFSRSTKDRMDEVFEGPLMEGGAEKFAANKVLGKPRFEGMSTYEVADAADLAPRESIFNWAKNSPGFSRASDYLVNFQGQTRYATPAVNAITQTLGPVGQALQIEKTNKMTPKEEAELEFLKRMAELNKKSGFDKFIEKPKLPEKFKKYKDDPRIIEIFGVQGED